MFSVKVCLLPGQGNERNIAIAEFVIKQHISIGYSSGFTASAIYKEGVVRIKSRFLLS